MAELVKYPRYRIGDQLQLKSRGPRWVGTVTEARGTYSPGGHVLYRLRVPMEPEPLFLLVREDEVDNPLALTQFAERVDRLMDMPNAKDVFLSRCFEYLRERKDHPDRPPPVDLVREANSSPLTLAEKYALLAALHTALNAGKKLDPVSKPENLTWEQFADQDFESYKDAVRWAALVDRVKEWLGPEKAKDIQAWVEEVETDLQREIHQVAV